MKKLIDSFIIFAFLVVFGLFTFSNTVFAGGGGGGFGFVCDYDGICGEDERAPCVDCESGFVDCVDYTCETNQNFWCINGWLITTGYCEHCLDAEDCGDDVTINNYTVESDCPEFYTCPDGTRIPYCEIVEQYNDEDELVGGGCGCREPQCPPEADEEGVENVLTIPDKEEETGEIVTTAGEDLAPSSPSITNQSCDALNPCSEGLECFSFPDIGLRCAQPNPCSYYTCPDGTQCAVAESYPGQVMCSCVGSECTATSSDEDTVSYDISKQTVIHAIKPDGQTVTHNISLLKATPENKGVLETTVASAKYSTELVVETSRLFMKTTTGKKPINVLPEDAISISEISNIEEIELKEDSQKPMYYVKGTKQAKILSIIPVSIEVETKIDAKTGNKISVNKPWWSFLAW